MQATKYKGYWIEECDYAPGEHKGKWYVAIRHKTGTTYADDACPHFMTKAAAKAHISAWVDHA